MGKAPFDSKQSKQYNKDAFYAFIGRVSLELVDNNVDAITIANFLREIMAAGEPPLTPEQAIEIARNYVDMTDANLAFSRA